MIVRFKNKTMTFDEKVMKKKDFDEFDAICRRSSVFKKMLPKARTKKIKEVWNEIGGKEKKASKSKPANDLSEDNKPGRELSSKSEQKPTSKGSDKSGGKNNSGLSK